MWTLREASPRDIGFVVDSWAQSWKGALENARKQDGDVYFPWAHRHINALLARPDVDLIIAAPEGDEDGHDIEGWACFEGDTLHYVYVSSRARKLGLARTLVGTREVKAYTHLVRYIDEQRIPREWVPQLTKGLLA